MDLLYHSGGIEFKATKIYDLVLLSFFKLLTFMRSLQKSSPSPAEIEDQVSDDEYDYECDVISLSSQNGCLMESSNDDSLVDFGN